MVKKNAFFYFSFLSIFILIFSFVLTYDRFTWFLEIFPILVVLPILIITYRRFQFTSLIYYLLIFHFTILAVGGIYSYAEVPFGFWMQEWFGFQRNNFDKIGHFAQGFVPALFLRELLIRTSDLKPGKWLQLIVISMCLAFSAFYEFIEWWTAVALGSSAEAFLGTQGYEWDAQSDMFLALIGAITALLLLTKFQNKLIENRYYLQDEATD